MAKDYEVHWGWQSPSLNRWISPGTAYLVPKLTDEEIAHAKAMGYITEVALPAGVKSVRDAQLKQFEQVMDAEDQQRKDEAKRSAKAIEQAQDESGSGPIARAPRGGR